MQKDTKKTRSQRHTDTETHRETQRDTQRHTETHRDRDTQRHRERETERHTDMCVSLYAYRSVCLQLCGGIVIIVIMLHINILIIIH